jgi:cation diffusion facilitator CzcD-associated flavoprotein CzcO
MAQSQTVPLDALIVGAGFAGLYQLHLLRDRLGLSVRAVEAAEGVGGTWYWNRYPGARCDSESHSYCFTFSEDLVKGWEWSERYPQQPEILRYLNYVADRLDLKRDISFNTRVIGARFDETAKVWVVETAQGETVRARFLVTAVGCLSTANVPDIPGRDTFKGRWEHTGAWPHDGVDFTGKRVGLIGTGSTGIQATPVIAETAAHLTVFQRTANYSVPARNVPLTDERKRAFKEQAEATRATMLASHNGHPFLIENRGAFDVSAEEREALYEAAWAKGGLQFRAHFKDILTDQAANDTAAAFIKRKIRATVQDPATAEILADIDHPYSAKRPPIDTGYFEAFNRPNVSLVDLRTDPIDAITPDGLRTRSAVFPLDIIVFATGFDAMTGPLLRMNIKGRLGKTLAEAWAQGPRTYLGLQVAGFPNLFTITGPGSPSVLTNMPVSIEQHAEWIAACIADMRREGLTTIEAKPEAVEKWVADVNAAADATLLPKVSHSWYLGANIPGKPRVFMPYAGGLPRYRAVCADVVANGYAGFLRA